MEKKPKLLSTRFHWIAQPTIQNEGNGPIHAIQRDVGKYFKPGKWEDLLASLQANSFLQLTGVVIELSEKMRYPPSSPSTPKRARQEQKQLSVVSCEGSHIWQWQFRE